MVTRAQPGIVRDVDVYRTLLARHDGTLGVMGTVRIEGTVREGDTVELLRSP